ncbi:MAG: DinB family protein [Chitinophagaceae bacterium]|nr:DinB family protein [Chitinophagaceae bacterium]
MQAYLETWGINQRMNEFLIDDIKEEHFNDISISRGRTVGEQLAHLHNVRLLWLKVSAPDLMQLQVKFEKEILITKELLLQELRKSAEAISKLLETGFNTGRIKGFKPHPEAFLGYMIAHESHHRGQIILILKQNGHIPDKKTLYGLWEWGTK